MTNITYIIYLYKQLEEKIAIQKLFIYNLKYNIACYAEHISHISFSGSFSGSFFKSLEFASGSIVNCCA